MARRPNTGRTRALALAYLRVSTTEQADLGASLDAQRTVLAAEARRRDWDIEFVSDAGTSGKVAPAKRDGLGPALERLDRGEADALLAVRLDRVSRSVADFAALLDRAQRRGWGVVLLSPALDLADPSGRFVANVLASAAQYERDLIAARTREGMAQRRAEGVHLGRRSAVPEDVRRRIIAARAAGTAYAKIADQLNADGVSTGQGARHWYPSSVRAVALAQAR
ncbi:recombinase family protein [Cellulomonas sp. 179-A 4D5 NHS]|uniref:recombinase family protein n=1 Tax=Cellulomonas sp. 179-A 4D5 NHS TaxID=3142378 RepID=UPI0039A201F5